MSNPSPNILILNLNRETGFMIIVMRKSNIILIGLIFALLLAIYSLNMDVDSQTATAANKTADQRTVIVDAGHGGEDPGKISNYSGLKEKDLNLKIAFKVKELLEQDNYNVIMTREEDKLVYKEGTTDIYYKRLQDLTRRKEIMDTSGADIVVSIHANSFTDPRYYGAQTFYPADSPESKKLAECIQKSLRENVDKNNKRGPQVKQTIVITKNLKTPTVIVETGFLSNAEEERKLATDEYQVLIAKAIRKGIDNYFK
jgi:N-acetylmuramoyl-L-alanine amidase